MLNHKVKKKLRILWMKFHSLSFFSFFIPFFSILSLFLSLSLNLYISLPLSFSLSTYISFSPSLSLFQSSSLSLTFNHLSLSPSLSLFQYIYLCSFLISFSVSSFSIHPSLPLSLSFFSICNYVYFFPFIFFSIYLY